MTHLTPPVLALLWDILLIAAVTFTAVETPVRLVMGYTLLPAFVAGDWLITGILCIDLVLRRGRPMPSRGSFHTQNSPANGSWRSWWGLVDLLAALPYPLLPGLSLVHNLRLVKLARVAGLIRYWRQSTVQHMPLLRLGFFIYWFALIAHWLACGWLALGGIPEAPDTLSRYVYGLYWCVTTLATVGYGDITPKTNVQMVYAMVVMILGVGIYGYVIGNVTSLLANLDMATNHYRETMERLAAFMRYRRLPAELQRRIRDYHAYVWENRLGYDEVTTMAELPISLRTDVALFLRRDFIERAPLFRGASHELVRELALELRPVVFTPGDYIFRAGQFGRHMYFISRGRVEIIATDGYTLLNTISEGDFFGEIALLFSQPRTASVRAVDYCDLYTLDKDTFDRVLTHYPDFAAHIRDMAYQRRPELEREETLKSRRDGGTTAP